MYLAQPFSLLRGEKTSKDGKGKQCDYYNISPSQILENSFTFCSRLFMVRFSEEVIELQDFCDFCTEIDILPKKSNDKCYASIELYFGDLTTMGPPELFDIEVIIFAIIGI